VAANGDDSAQPWQDETQTEEAAVPVEAEIATETEASGPRIRFAEEVGTKDGPAKKKKAKKGEKVAPDGEVELKAKKAPKRARHLAVADDDDEEIDLEDFGNWVDKDEDLENDG
jgi:hypothetical protein